VAGVSKVAVLLRLVGLGMKPKSGLNFANRFNFDHTQIIENDGLGVGFLMTLEHGSDLTLHTVCILPESQGRGFGTAIIREVLDAASARNRGVIVSVLKANSAARSLYERLGFVVTEESTHHIHHTSALQASLLMSRGFMERRQSNWLVAVLCKHC
jgi:ribosomal protein S18 acetylase RimI-like enzyme